MSTWSARGAVAAAAAAGAFAVAPAGAHQRLRITQPPTLSGVAQEGSRLDAVGARWTGPSDTEVTWHWLRCHEECEEIDGASAASYVPSAADVGDQLVAWLRLTAGKRHADAWTPPSAAVLAAPSPPIPTPTPTPIATPRPVPTPVPPPPAPLATVTAPAVGAAPTVGAAPRQPRRMRPRPVVRIRGVLTVGGARITLFTVLAPRGVRIAATCRPGCGVAQVTRVAHARVSRLRAFERDLPAGARLEIVVTKRGYIGKRTVIVIRRGKPPARRDGCLAMGSTHRVVACPGAG